MSKTQKFLFLRVGVEIAMETSLFQPPPLLRRERSVALFVVLLGRRELLVETFNTFFLVRVTLNCFLSFSSAEKRFNYLFDVSSSVRGRASKRNIG